PAPRRGRLPGRVPGVADRPSAAARRAPPTRPRPRHRPGRGPASAACFVFGPSGTSSRTGERDRDRLTYHRSGARALPDSRPTTGPDRSAWDPPRRDAMTPGAEPNDDSSPRATPPGNRLRTPRTKRDHPLDPSDEAASRSDTLLATEPFRDGPESPREGLT